MRKTLIVGNWKMNLERLGARSLVSAIRSKLDPQSARLKEQREIAVAPPFVLLYAVSQELAGSDILLAAQNMHFEDSGAYTGEVSPPMLKPFGVRYVILGHSERRQFFKETDDLINKKVKAALRHRINPILCVGETADQRKEGRTLDVVMAQLEGGLEGIEASQLSSLTIAYEPVWAIGTGVNATPEQAQEVHGIIRNRLQARFGTELAQGARILYGGSVTPENAASLLAMPDIDGALVGGASLKADSFAAIVMAGLG